MGNDTVLAEALSEDQHDLLVSLMKVTMTIVIVSLNKYKLNIQRSSLRYSQGSGEAVR